MGQKQDIGKIFENKLDAGKKNPTESLWEKINTSLDEEKRRRKRILFYWLVGGGLSVLLGSFLLFGSEIFTPQNSKTPQQHNSLEQKLFTDSASEKEDMDAPFTISKVDSLNVEKNKERKLSKIEIFKNDSIVGNNENPSTPNSKRKIQKGSANQKGSFENYSVSKKYYYYNSRTGTQIETTDKSEIDSLVSEQYKTIDSVAIKKNDTI